MINRFLHFKKVLCTTLFFLLLSVTGMTKVYAQDFSAVCPSGQTLYYNIIDSVNHYVELCPYFGSSSGGGITGGGGDIGGDFPDDYKPYWFQISIYYGKDYYVPRPSGDVVLSESVECNDETYTLTSIGRMAFIDCRELTSVTLPNSVTSIGEKAFGGCTGLTSVNIPNSVTSIGDEAFGGCAVLTSVTIPNTVTSIGYATFYGCRNLVSIALPGSLETIGSSAFVRCTSLEHIAIPNSVTSIGNYAFSFSGIKHLEMPEGVTTIAKELCAGCGELVSVVLPNTVTSINDHAFVWCSSLNELIDFAETPPALGVDVFFVYSNPGWKSSKDINANPTNLHVCAPCGFEAAYASISWGGISDFRGMCGGVVAVTADSEEGGTVTGGGSFEEHSFCTVTAVSNEGYTFEHWELNDGTVVSNTADYTFVVCGDMTLVAHFVSNDNIPFADANVKSICINLWDSNNDGELSYEEAASVTNLGNYFRSNSRITSFNELQYFIGLSSIGNAAFMNCTRLSSIVLPNTLTSIGDYAFYYCTSLKGLLVLPNSVTSIGSYAFYYCNSITGSLTLPNSVTSIGSCAFYYCNSITGSLTLPNSVTSIGNYAFYSCRGFTGSLTLSNYLTSIGDHAFSYCSGFTGSLILPNFLTSIGDYAFSNCNGFTGSLTLPNFWTSIGHGVFSGCSGLTSLILPNSLTSIGSDAFSYCSGFSGSLTIPNSVTTIGDYAFYNCNGFSGSLTIPNSVTYIGNSAFSFCSGLTSMTVLADNPPIIGNITFNGVNKGIPVYVPCGSLETYQHVSGWFEFNNYVPATACDSGEITAIAYPVEGGTVTGDGYYDGGVICTLTATANSGYSFINWTKDGIGVSNTDSYSFYVAGDASYVANFVQDTDITFADANVKALCVANWDTNGDGELSYAEAAAVTNLGMVFGNKSNITNFDELQYFVGLTSIGRDAFYGCGGLTSIKIPNSVISIGEYAFYYCSGLTTIEIPNSVTSIGSFVFYNCRSLISMEIPNSVTSIGDYAFYYCSGLTSIEIPNSVTSIGSSTFSSCSGLTSLTLSNSLTSIGSFAFYNCSGLMSIEIPNSVTSIGGSAFYGCSGLSEVLSLGSTPPTLGSSTSFDGSVCPIYVPYESLNDYKTATNWIYYGNRIFPMAYSTIPGYGDDTEGWAFVASPLVESTVPSAVDNMVVIQNYDLYRFNQSAEQEWENSKAINGDEDAFLLANGQGYLYASDEDVNLFFKGLFNENESEEIGLIYDENAPFRGWNLVGNPFPVKAFADRSYYVMNEDGTAIEPVAVSSSTAVNPCTGIMVKAEAPNETVTFARTAAKTTSNRGNVQITVAESPNDAIVDRVILSFTPGDELEKYVFNKNTSQLYLQQDGKDYAVACVDGAGELPICFKASQGGSYTLRISKANKEFTYLHLIDTVNGADVDLLQQPSYSFESTTTDVTNRFKLIFK